jgi:hypothetical protein
MWFMGCGRKKELTEKGRESPPVAGETLRGQVAPGHLIDSDEVAELHDRGLADPIRQLVDSLEAHPEVISHPGVLGGSMGFYAKDIHILNKEWVYARFDDGHIGGSGVFAFDLGDDGRIRWHTVISSLDTAGLEP